MGRTRADLRDISFRLQALVTTQFPGLALVGPIFDATAREGIDRPINIMCIGVKEDEALAVLKLSTDTIQKVVNGERGRLMGEDSLLVTPSFQDLNKILKKS